MSRFIKYPVIIALVIGSLVRAGAVGKITTDPNTPEAHEAAVQKQSTESDDPRLDKEISYECIDLPLSQMLSEISHMGEVRMLPSSSKENWQVRQRTGIVFINDRPIRELKNSLSLLYGYRWSYVTQDNSEKAYIFRDTLKSQTARQASIDKQKQEACMKRAEGIDSALDTAYKSQDLSLDEIKAARENDPYLYYLSSDPVGKLWSQFMQQVPDEWWRSIVEGTRKTYMMGSDVPDGIRSLIGKILASPPSATSIVSWVPPYTASADARSLPIIAIGVCPGDSVNNPDSSTANFHVLYQTSQGPLDAIAFFPVGSSTSPNCFVLGKQAIAMEDGKDIEDAFETAFSSLKTDYSKFHQSTQIEEKTDEKLLREIEHKPIPIYDKDGKLIEETGLAQQLRGLAKETGYTILVETFDWPSYERTIYTDGGFPPSKGTIQDVIKGITLGFYNWEKKGNTLLFRPKDWERRRALEVNKEKVKQWEQLAKTQGGLLFNDMLDVVQNTTFDQIKETLMANTVLREAGIKNIYFSLYGILRLISLMPDNASREALGSESGLPVGVLRGIDLSEEQLKPYRELAQNGSDDTTIGIVVRNRGKDNKDGRQEVVVFTRRGTDTVSTQTYSILPDFQTVAVRATLRQREIAENRTQPK